MEWLRGEVLGYGSFSTVNLAINKNPGTQFPQLMAVKTASFPHLDMILREKSILEELDDCPHIIRCFGGDYSIEKGEKSYNLVLEYANGGALADIVKKNSRFSLPESRIRRYTKLILEGVKYIHENGYSHNDLKLENILLCSDTVKIADFGLATRVGERRGREGVELRGTPLYMSPEAVSSGEQGAPADIWAVGCMVVEMVAGAPAWRCLPESGILQLLMRIGVGDELPETPRDLSSDGKDFLERIFVKDPIQRWTAQMLLDHPFVNGQCFEEDSPRGPFDWVNEYERIQSPCSITETPSSDFETWSSTPSDFDFDTSKRLRKLVTRQQPDWSTTDGWINVR